jgi:hypothetical protein
VALIKAAVRREGLRLSQSEAERTASKVRIVGQGRYLSFTEAGLPLDRPVREIS